MTDTLALLDQADTTWRGLPHLPPPPDLVIDFEADNVLLREALVRSVSAGVRRDLVADELKHRIVNLLAVVQAIARQTFRDGDAESLADFNARLAALAAAQKLLIDAESDAAKLRDTVITALAPHCADGDRCTIAGPIVALDGRRAHALTLALHELATNAAKYGALSAERGWIEVIWTNVGGTLDFLWREQGGPPVATPTRKGFGSRLITHNLAAAFDGAVDLTFKSAGLECRLQAPLA